MLGCQRGVVIEGVPEGAQFQLREIAKALVNRAAPAQPAEQLLDAAQSAAVGLIPGLLTGGCESLEALPGADDAELQVRAEPGGHLGGGIAQFPVVGPSIGTLEKPIQPLQGRCGPGFWNRFAIAEEPELTQVRDRRVRDLFRHDNALRFGHERCGHCPMPLTVPCAVGLQLGAGPRRFDPLQADAVVLQGAANAGITDPPNEALTVGMGQDLAAAVALGKARQNLFRSSPLNQ